MTGETGMIYRVTFSAQTNPLLSLLLKQDKMSNDWGEWYDLSYHFFCANEPSSFFVPQAR
jgi:hypothetical protein